MYEQGANCVNVLGRMFQAKGTASTMSQRWKHDPIQGWVRKS